MRFIKFAVLAALFAVPVCSADAGILVQNLSFNGFEDVIIDQSRSNIVDANEDGVFSVGDAVYGYLSFDEVQLDNGTQTDIVGGQLATLFALEVTEDFGDDVFGLSASTVVGFTLGDLLDADLLAAGVDGEAIDADTLAVVVGSTSTLEPENVAQNLGFFSAASGYEIELTAGLALDTDFFQVTDNGDFDFDESAGLSVLQTGAGLPDPSSFLPVDAATQFAGPFESDATAQISLVGTIGPNNPNANDFFNPATGEGFLLQNQAQVSLNAVPEPTSALAFVGIFGLAVRRRRKS